MLGVAKIVKDAKVSNGSRRMLGMAKIISHLARDNFCHCFANFCHILAISNVPHCSNVILFVIITTS